MKNSRLGRILSLSIVLALIPLTVALGAILLAGRRYALISILVALLSCLPFFIRFERGRSTARELIVVAVMSALSVTGRILFAPVPGFKPVTALTVISGLSLGAEAGFLVGSVSAIVSNLFYGQGPWTPFQMLVWGLIGFLAGLLLRRRPFTGRIPLLVFGALAGVLYSLVMDLWTVLSLGEGFSVPRYLAAVGVSLPFLLTYAASNVLFLLLLAPTLTEKLQRLKRKFGLFDSRTE